LVFGLGLLLILVGERLFGHLGGVRMVLTGAGLAAVLGVTALRGWTTSASAGARRRVERALLVCQIGAILSLVLYAFTTKRGDRRMWHNPARHLLLDDVLAGDV